MGFIKYKFGELIELTNVKNSDERYGEDDAIGVNIDKVIMPMRGNIAEKDFSTFHLVPPRHFAYNPRGSRKLGIGFNNTENTYIITFNDNVFKVKESAKEIILDTYLFMYLSRKEWDRYAEFISWGSSTEVFDWNIFCEEEIDLPPLPIQQKYVDIYNAMIANQQSYERGLEDLKLVCDAYIDKLKHSKNKVPIGKYVVQIDNRNKANQPYKFKGLSMDNYFIDSIADANGLDFSNYKIIAPGEYGAVLMKVGRDGRLTIARNDSDENYLISPAYYAFTTTGINSDYFMANVNRSEFERRGWFSCDTSARGSLSWDEFLNLKIPDADEKEQVIVSELHRVLLTRTEINEKLKAQIKDICPILIKGSIEEARKTKEA